MNRFLKFAMIFIAIFISAVFLSSCDDEKKMQSSTSIIGTWRIDNRHDGGGYYEFCFKEDGTGYEEHQEYSGEQVKHWDISYKVREGKITIYYGEDEDWWDWTLDFDISTDGKILTIYGMDDNDMKVMKFKRK